MQLSFYICFLHITLNIWIVRGAENTSNTIREDIADKSKLYKLCKIENIEEKTEEFFEFLKKGFKEAKINEMIDEPSIYLNLTADFIDKLFIPSDNFSKCLKKYDIKICDNKKDFYTKIKEASEKFNEYIEKHKKEKMKGDGEKIHPAYVILTALYQFYLNLKTLEFNIPAIFYENNNIDKHLVLCFRLLNDGADNNDKKFINLLKKNFPKKDEPSFSNDFIVLNNSYRCLFYTFFSLIYNFYSEIISKMGKSSHEIIYLNENPNLSEIIDFSIKLTNNEENIRFFKKYRVFDNPYHFYTNCMTLAIEMMINDEFE